jgi:hypothetical protein
VVLGLIGVLTGLLFDGMSNTLPVAEDAGRPELW